MLALRNFILYGVDWQGQVDDVKFMQARATRVLLQSLADQTNIKNTAASIKKSRPALSGYLYERSTVSAVIRRLKLLGLVNRDRAGRKGSTHEEFAPTTVVATLVVAAIQWQKECKKLQNAGKREENARPAKTAMRIPLKSTSTSGELSPERLAEDQHPNTGHTSYQNLETVSICTPPPSRNETFQGGRGRETLPPVSASESVPESALVLNFGGHRIFKNYRPFPDSRAVLDLQNFINWLFIVNQSDKLTAVTLMRAGVTGQLEIYKKGSQSLTSAAPHELLTTVYAKSQELFEKTGSGEQLYFGPRPGSRVVLLDDISTDQPILPDHQCAILETSAGNYQHFYVCQRGLEQHERRSLQVALAGQFGGDPKATNGHQPHRAPGSVNYKLGRNCFVTRLVFCEAAGAVLAAPEPVAMSMSAEADGGDRRLNEPRVGGIKSPSEDDWAWVLKRWHLGESELIKQLMMTSTDRGKHRDYAANTVESVARFLNSRAS